MTTQWHFVIAAYAVTFAGTAALLLNSYWRMRGAERRAQGLNAGRDSVS